MTRLWSQLRCNFKIQRHHLLIITYSCFVSKQFGTIQWKYLKMVKPPTNHRRWNGNVFYPGHDETKDWFFTKRSFLCFRNVTKKFSSIILMMGEMQYWHCRHNSSWLELPKDLRPLLRRRNGDDDWDVNCPPFKFYTF